MNDRFSAREAGEHLANVGVVAVDFPDSDNPTSASSVSAMMRAIQEIPVGTLALDRRFMPGISDYTTHAELIDIADHGKTRRASKHKVGFGQLLLHAADEGESSLYVASKPVRDSVLAHEYGVTSLVAQGGMPYADTFRPVGVVRKDDGKAAMLTHYRHPVRSLDNIFANPDLIDETMVVDKALQRAGAAIATPHAHDWVQRDTQTKNVAWDVSRKDTDRSFLVDLEVAVPVSGLTQPEKDAQKLEDIRVFVASAHELESLGCEMPEDFEERMIEVFGSAYLTRLAHLGAVATDIDASLIAQVVDEAPRLRGNRVISTRS